MEKAKRLILAFGRNVKNTYSKLLRKKCFLVWLGVYIVLRWLDCFGTLQWIYVLGIQAEGNLISRWFFWSFGIIPGMLLQFFTIVLPLIFITILIFYKLYYEKGEHNLFWVLLWSINLFTLFVVIQHFSVSI